MSFDSSNPPPANRLSDVEEGEINEEPSTATDNKGKSSPLTKATDANTTAKSTITNNIATPPLSNNGSSMDNQKEEIKSFNDEIEKFNDGVNCDDNNNEGVKDKKRLQVPRKRTCPGEVTSDDDPFEEYERLARRTKARSSSRDRHTPPPAHRSSPSSQQFHEERRSSRDSRRRSRSRGHRSPSRHSSRSRHRSRSRNEHILVHAINVHVTIAITDNLIDILVNEIADTIAEVLQDARHQVDIVHLQRTKSAMQPAHQEQFHHCRRRKNIVEMMV
ncbi:hypothetical protein BDA99DRAFT_149245 [Phascolomyces articulosus]|uniref:Uncharacterized protein n=1 Tax=Phascolomyces articulosus TaxID=60185 RepID=A0AAD5K5A6_9FUNG|nr:hypothetical protein BDA99DRAFT_149245 [Phascolomyces articulosus]